MNLSEAIESVKTRLNGDYYYTVHAAILNAIVNAAEHSQAVIEREHEEALCEDMLWDTKVASKKHADLRLEILDSPES